MKQRCEREDQTTAAIHSGMIGDEITAHAQHCPVCTEVLLVSELLQEGDALTDHERIALPDANRIWQTARFRAHQDDMRLALRPIRFMKIVAIIVFACSPWLRLLLSIGRELTSSWSKTLDSNFAFALKIRPVAPNQAAILLGFTAATVLLGLSSWYMVRQE